MAKKVNFVHGSLIIILLILILNPSYGEISKRRIIHGMDKGLNNRLNFIRFFGRHNSMTALNKDKHQIAMIANKHRFLGPGKLPNAHKPFQAIGPYYKPGPKFFTHQYPSTTGSDAKRELAL